MRNFLEKRHLLMEGIESLGGGTGEEKVNIRPDETKDSVVYNASNETADLNLDVVQTRIDELKKQNPELFQKLKDAGILKNNLENTHQFEKLKKYFEYLNSLDKVITEADLYNSSSQVLSETSKKDVKEKYFELKSSTKTDKILNKEYIAYKYLEAMLLDIHNMGYSIEKSDNGYVVRDMKCNEVDVSVLGEYSDILIKEKLDSNIMNTAILSNIIVRNSEFKTVLTQKDFVNKIFKKHNILSGRNDEDKSKYIITDKDNIVKEISQKLANSKSIDEHRELSYLKEFVLNYTDGKDYDAFKSANSYAKGFLVQKALFDAFPNGKIPGIDGSSNASTTEKIAGFIEQNRGSAILVGLISWLMGYKKTAITALGVGIFGGSVGDLIKGGGKAALKEDLIDPIEKGQLAPLVDRKEYQTNADKLFAANYKESKASYEKLDGEIYRAPSNDIIDNTKLENIISIVIENDINLDLRDPDIEQKLRSELGEKFYTEQEVKSFIKLLKKSGIKEDGDKTILDYLANGGKDILNNSFKSISPTGTAYDSEINKILSEKYNKSTSRQEKANIEDLANNIKGNFSTASEIFDKIKNGDFASLNETEAKVNDSISYIEKNMPELLNQFKDIFKDYQRFIKIEGEVAKFSGIYDENIDKAKAIVSDVLGTKEEAQISSSVVLKIESLEELLIQNPKNEDQKDLNIKISKLIEKLKEVNDYINEEDDKKYGNASKKSFDRFDKATGIDTLLSEVDNNNKDIDLLISNIKSSSNINEMFVKLESEKEKVENQIKYASEVKTKTLLGSAPSSSSHLDNMANKQKLIVDRLNEFETTKKLELENAIKSKLEVHFNENVSNLKKLDDIKLVNVEDAINKLNSINPTGSSFEANKTYDLAKELFGNSFNIPNSGIEVKTVENRKDVIIDNLNKSISDFINKNITKYKIADLKNYHITLNNIMNVPALNNLKGDILTKQGDVREIYINNAKIGENTEIYDGIKYDIASGGTLMANYIIELTKKGINIDNLVIEDFNGDLVKYYKSKGGNISEVAKTKYYLAYSNREIIKYQK